MGGNTVSAWADERLAVRAKALWVDGHSCSQIATALNREFDAGLSRNSIIGKLTRMGLSGKGHGSERKASAPRDLTAPPVLRFKAPPVAKGHPNPCGNMKTKAPRLSLAGKNMVFEAAPDAPMPKLTHLGATGTPARIIDPGFTSKGCKWPISMPPRGMEADTLFCCGKRDGDPRYCAVHAKLAASPNQPKKKLDPAPLGGGQAFRFSGGPRRAA